MITVREILEEGECAFAQAQLHFGHGTDNPWDDALALVLFALKQPIEAPLSLLDESISSEQAAAIRLLYAKRIKDRVPVPYLTQEAYFCGLPFYVDERVLIPRSSFGELIEQQFSPWIRDPLKVERILEIGTGSGCIAIACAMAFPNAQIMASDISPDALAVADINVRRYALNDRISLCLSDGFEQILPQQFDLIISNPPYVGAPEMETLPAEYQHEPELALRAGEDGLSIVRGLLEHAPRYLKDDGLLAIEVGNTETTVLEAFPNLPFIWPDFENSEGGVFLLEGSCFKKY